MTSPMPDTPGSPDTPAIPDTFETWDRIYLDKLRLAANVILQAGEDPEALTPTFETELFRFRDAIDRAMLLKPHDLTGLRSREPRAPRPTPALAPAPEGDGPPAPEGDTTPIA